MSKKNIEECGCNPKIANMGNCRVEAIVPVDARGQVVIPKDIREKLGIKPLDKLVIISWEKDGLVTSISLMKNDVFSEILKQK